MSHNPYEQWESVIGLEIHVALNTKSKLFSHAPNRFGDTPNTNITEVCTGQPGALPVLNKEAVRKAVQFGCAVQASVEKFSKFDRKSYFYPDSPRNFQITQFDQPILKGGIIITDVDGERMEFEIDRAHLEDDAGMLKHFKGYAGVDYNRAGVPLLEIVSKPCLHSPRQAACYGMAVKAIMEYIGASDCNMEKGNLRMDANISVRKKGEQGFRNKIEIKNMNSFHNMEQALEVEIKRQITLYLNNPEIAPAELIPQATFRWDPEKKKTELMRRKEEADDYRYFPEPDLVPILLTDEYIDSIREALPELPYQRKKRYQEELELNEISAQILTQEKRCSDYFEQALTYTENAKSLCNWITVEFSGRLKDCEKDLWELSIPPQEIAQLVNYIDTGKINGKIAKKVADEMIKHPHKSCKSIISENPDFQPMNDTNALEEIVAQVMQENPKSVNDYKAGKQKAFGFLVGQVMKQTRGKASPNIVNELLKKKLENS
jgi:aspartyl-tRNA(Asn)/glutamyl-tRNA(Gln) amidotransferase subunit B